MAIPTLRTGNYDQGTIMLHAMVEIARDFVNEELSTGYHDTKAHDFKAIRDTVKWFDTKWKKRHKFDVHGKPLPKQPKGGVDKGMRTKPEIINGARVHRIVFSKEYRAYADKINKAKAEWHKAEDQALGLLVKLRRSMWV